MALYTVETRKPRWMYNARPLNVAGLGTVDQTTSSFPSASVPTPVPPGTPAIMNPALLTALISQNNLVPMLMTADYGAPTGTGSGIGSFVSQYGVTIAGGLAAFVAGLAFAKFATKKKGA